MRLHRMAINTTLATTIFLLLQACSTPTTSAQMDWLKTGQVLLETVTKNPQTETSSLTSSEITRGLKEALRVGTETVVGQLGQLDGFNSDPEIRIPLPKELQQVKTTLSMIGLDSMMNDLELKLNRAAEEATPPAKNLFWSSIKTMTLDDVMGIYNGADDAATRYFQNKMSEPLTTAMQPIVEQTLNQVGAIQAYDTVMGEYAALPFMPDIRADLNSYVVEKGMEGIFHYLAQEEAAIRQNPLKRTTDILQRVFGTE